MISKIKWLALTLLLSSFALAQETVIYQFGAAGPNDGSLPNGGLVFDTEGNIYGTTALGGQGTDCCGVVFEVTSSGVENVLHTFTDGADGGSPDTDLIQDSNGSLYGGALGGTYGYGVIFKIAP